MHRVPPTVVRCLAALALLAATGCGAQVAQTRWVYYPQPQTTDPPATDAVPTEVAPAPEPVQTVDAPALTGPIPVVMRPAPPNRPPR